MKQSRFSFTTVYYLYSCTFILGKQIHKDVEIALRLNIEKKTESYKEKKQKQMNKSKKGAF